MLENIPSILSIGFLLTSVATIYFFYKASNFSKPFLNIIIIWFSIQALLGINKFYTVSNTFPPRFILLVFPALVGIVLLFTLPKGRLFLDKLNPRYLILIHVVRIPVELVLYYLYLYKAIPQFMTFEGRNLDILIGISAPIVFSLTFRYQKSKKILLLVWNVIGLAFLVNIVSLAVLSAPFPFQQLAFDQPNIAVLYFPFNCLPAIVVPLVLLSHLASIRNGLKS